jgi:integrase
MSTFPTYRLRDIIPSEGELQAMGRRRFQRPNVFKTKGGRPEWFFRARVDALGMQNEKPSKRRPEKPFYLGFCDEIGITEARKRRDEILAEVVNKPQTLIPSQVKFGEVLAVYRKDHLAQLRETTRTDQESSIRRHIEPTFGPLRMCDIEALEVQRWISGMGLAQSTRKQMVTLMRVIWNRAEEWGFVRRPFPRAKYVFSGAKEVKGRQMPSLDQLRRLLAVLPDPYRAMAEIILTCGLRISEVRGLKWSDVGPHMLTVQRRISNCGDVDRRKNDKDQVFDVRPLAPIFARLPKDGEYVFGLGTSYTRCKEAMQTARETAGITVARFGWHHLRACCNTLLRSNGADATDRQAVLGHATEATNALYIHGSENDLKRRGDLMLGVQALVMGEVGEKVQ